MSPEVAEMEEKTDLIIGTEELAGYEELVRHLAGAMRVHKIYAPNHSIVATTRKRFMNILYGQIQDQPKITIGIIGDEVVAEDTPLTRLTPTVPGFVKDLRRWQIGKITFSKGVDEGELEKLFTSLAEEPAPETMGHSFGKRLSSMGVRYIAVGGDIAGSVDDESKGSQMVAALRNYNSILSAMSGLMEELRRRGSLDLDAARGIVDKVMENIFIDRSPFLVMTSLKNRDDYTFTHSVNVSILVMSLAEKLGLEEDLVRDFGTAGLMHDLGKEEIPIEIIQAPRKLTDEEFALMRKHPVWGAKVLATTKGVPDIAPIVAFEHHICVDYGGYPRTRKKRTPHLCSLMTAVADVYDALRSERPYAAEFPAQKILAILDDEQQKNRLESTLVKRLVDMMGMYPQGAVLRLSTGEIGVVYSQNPKDSYRPKIRIALGPDGIAPSSVMYANLWERDPHSGQYRRTVVESIDPATVSIDPADYLD